MQFSIIAKTYLNLDLVGVTIVNLAERLNIRRILTADRDFRISHPQYFDYFEVSP
jgi:predicted nucleic acid-binding protein